MVKQYGDTYAEVLQKVCDAQIDVWPSKFEVLDEEGIFRLLHYRPITEAKYRTPVLIVYAFINRPYVLDMRLEISVVNKYQQAGFDVYMVDWGYPTRADKYLDLDDYVDYLDKSVELIKRRNEVERVTIHGYCLGGTLSVVYSALRPDNVANLVLSATPIDFHTNNLLAVWARAMDPDKIADAFDMAPGEFLNVGFLMVDPINLIVGKYQGLLDTLESTEAIANFMCMDRWIFDSPAIPAATFRQYIREWYHENRLFKGEFKALGQTVDLSRIKASLLLLLATYDHIAPPEASKVILDKVSSTDKEVYQTDKGHIGITTSRASHKEFWPKVVKWVEQRSEILE
ncbi:MAG TPA: alpha/beta fold hydrolase [Dehalococcoidia bacterium]|nr:alpha/beta fold hydrolase [Dehalococcoidia bacterium]